MKILVLFTSQFPYRKGEVFIENEFPFLCAQFDKIYLITTWEPQKEIRPTPAHVEVITLSYGSSIFLKAATLLYLFNPIFWKEFYNVRRLYKLPLSPRLVAMMFSALAKGLKVRNFLSKKLFTGTFLQSNQVLLYSYWLNDFSIGLALIKKKHPGIKAIARAHRWDLYFEAHTPPYIPFRSLILNALDYCYFISENGLNYLDNLTQKRFTPRLKLARLGTFNPTGNLSNPNTDRLVIVSCSYVIPNKRVYLIIEALSLIKEISIEWTHFGTGAQMIQTIELANRKLNATQIRYEFRGETSNTDILEFYSKNNVDLFINVSDSEGMPVSMMEAMSFSIPVIGTNVGGVSEIIEDNKNGFLLDAHTDALQIANAIMKFRNLPEDTKNQFKQAALHKWKTEYNGESNYRSFMLELDRVLSEG